MTSYNRCVIQPFFKCLANYILEFRYVSYVILLLFILLQYFSILSPNNRGCELKKKRNVVFTMHQQKLLYDSVKNGHALEFKPQTISLNLLNIFLWEFKNQNSGISSFKSFLVYSFFFFACTIRTIQCT